MNQVLIIAEMIMVRTMRSRLPAALFLLSLPLLLAIWMINAESPGYQTLFAKDAGGLFLSLVAMVMALVMCLEHLIWSDGENRGWFMLSRVKNYLHLFFGQFLGIAFSLMAAIGGLSLLFFIFYRLMQGAWLPEIMFTGYFVFLEAMVLVAALILLSRIFSRFLAISWIILLYVFSSTSLAQVFKSASFDDGLTLIGSLFLSLIPDLSMFRFSGLILEREILSSQEALISSFYAIFITGFYLLVADLLARRQRKN